MRPHRSTRMSSTTARRTSRGQKQFLYHSPYRGFMSTMDDREHFGVGRSTSVDSLEVIWPDRRSQVLTNVAVDRTITVRQRDASPHPHTPPLRQTLSSPP